MRIGLSGLGSGVEQAVRYAQRAEADGFTSLWYNSSFLGDPLAPIAIAARATSSIEFGTAVLQSYTSHPVLQAGRARSVAAAIGAPGRFSLGIGPAHATIVEGALGLSYATPGRHTDEYVQILAPLLRGEAVDFDGEEFQVSVPAAASGAVPEVPLLIAALAPRLLRIAGEQSAGTVTWMANAASIERHVAPRIAKAAARAGRPEPRIVVGLPVAVHDDVDQAREHAGRQFAVYGTLPNYRRVMTIGGIDGPADAAIVGDEAAVADPRGLRRWGDGFLGRAVRRRRRRAGFPDADPRAPHAASRRIADGRLRLRHGSDDGQRGALDMRRILVIGVGAGRPEYVTMQAVEALNQVDVFFLIDKGDVKDELIAVRREICARYIAADHPYRFVQARDPERDRDAAHYEAAVGDWHDERARILATQIEQELGPDGVGAFLVWGDPSLYDSTIRVIERILASGQVEFDWSVIAGITSIQALVAQHRIPLNRIGEPIHITTGRRLAAEGMDGQTNVVVMLDAHLAAGALPESEAAATDIYWGAYLGTPDEALISGAVPEVIAEIASTRAALRSRKGWIMDTYLLRRRSSDR
jgi:precorrin-6A synthase